MRNAFVVIKTQNKLLDGDFAMAEIFRKNGYIFDETRSFSYQSDACKRSFTALKQEFDLVVVAVEQSLLNAVLQVITGVYDEKCFQNAGNGAGAFVENGKTLFLLALDGEKSRAYVSEVALPILNRVYGVRFDRVVIRSVGASKERVASLIARANELAKGKVRVFDERTYDEDVIEIVYDQTVSKMQVDDIVRLFADGLGDTVYAMDDTPLEQTLIELLKLRRRKISVAESFTGGGIAKKLTSVSGASEVYFEGLNTYAEDAKIKRLGVSEYTLKTVGAVSDQTAYEMAMGLLSTGDADISVATTGIAGPNSDKFGVPVGVCYIAVGTKEKVYVYRYKFDGNRRDITEKAIQYAMFTAYKHLKRM